MNLVTRTYCWARRALGTPLSRRSWESVSTAGARTTWRSADTLTASVSFITFEIYLYCVINY